MTLVAAPRGWGKTTALEMARKRRESEMVALDTMEPITQAPPSDPVEGVAAEIETAVRLAVARVVAEHGIAQGAPLMRAVGAGVGEALGTYRQRSASPALMQPPGGGPGAPLGELNELRAALWRVGTGATTDWACWCSGGAEGTRRYTLIVRE